MRYLLTLILILLSNNANALYEEQRRNEELFRQTGELRRINQSNDFRIWEDHQNSLHHNNYRR